MRAKRGATLIELLGLLFFLGALAILGTGFVLTRLEQKADCVH